jgi:hypothetical protein
LLSVCAPLHPLPWDDVEKRCLLATGSPLEGWFSALISLTMFNPDSNPDWSVSNLIPSQPPDPSCPVARTLDADEENFS